MKCHCVSIYNDLMMCRIPSIIGVFYDAKVFNGNLSKWDTSKVTGTPCKLKSCFSCRYMKCHYVVISNALMMSRIPSIIAMFLGANVFNGDVSNWDTNKVTSMDSKSFVFLIMRCHYVVICHALMMFYSINYRNVL
jgi:surface protein